MVEEILAKGEIEIKTNIAPVVERVCLLSHMEDKATFPCATVCLFAHSEDFVYASKMLQLNKNILGRVPFWRELICQTSLTNGRLSVCGLERPALRAVVLYSP